ncbi:Ankyrin repeat protein 1 [Giardia muris]|uniref:Ankyrin repeat protein 1 n=1 Tax=Giardia muris TaxID=5742 RepID=A0A4Z1SRH7_GIAMU|nr:Ankyrin repeat protein 1 [Giardia muris]|eukprot:TNJ28466.1 Ankyrin repeat protein 1 [Giardia muris]
MARLAVLPPKTPNFETKIVTNHVATYHWNKIALAAASGHEESVRDYVQKQNGPIDTFIPDCVYFGWKAFEEPNALILAAGHGHVECVRILVNTNEKSARTPKTRQTALMAAAAACYPEIVQLLLDQAGNKDMRGWTALMYAADRGSPDCCRMLVRVEAGQKDETSQSALLLAAIGGHLEAVREIAPSEAKDFGGFVTSIIEDGPIKDEIMKYLV